MARKLTDNVLVRDPAAGGSTLLTAGSELPDWASDLVGDHVLESDEGQSDEGQSDDDPDTPPPALAGPGGSRAKWADYARTKGVAVGTDASREDIIAACRAAGVRTD